MRKNFIIFFILYSLLFSVNAQVLYSTTSNEGAFGGGTIVKYDEADHSLISTFNFEAEAAEPLYNSLFQAADGKFYGMTPKGGAYGLGVIFSMNPVNSEFHVVHNFNHLNGDGPTGGLIQAANGLLYGVTQKGGLSNNLGNSGPGVIFSYNPVTGVYSKLKVFDGQHGSGPIGKLVEASNGILYGMAGGGLNGAGVIYSFDPVSSVFTKLIDFDGLNGSSPNGSLFQASDGKLYGMTPYGGVNNEGVIFSFDPSTSLLLKLKDLDFLSGNNPFGNLIEASDGNFYGMTYVGGSNGKGVVFKFNPVNSNYLILKAFDGPDGAYPYGSLCQASNGKLFGMTTSGGSSNGGVLFSFDLISNGFTKLKDFDFSSDHALRGGLIQTADGNLYGMAGGTTGSGALFKFHPSSFEYSILKNFGINEFGSFPSKGLYKCSDGKLYGTTFSGGDLGNGEIFSFNPTVGNITPLFSFSQEIGHNADESIMQASNGKLYGTTNSGGINNSGIIYSFELETSTFSNLFDFGPEYGQNANGRLVQHNNGKLYGVTNTGGVNGRGVIFSFDPANSNYNKIHDFDGTNGQYPMSGLMMANDEKMYGITELGGSNSNEGVIYSFDPATSIYLKLFDFNSVMGASPTGRLIQAFDGKLYGITKFGGSNNMGVIFSFDPISSSYNKLFNFDGVNGSLPLTSLTQGSNGKLYGTTSTGGINEKGVMFSYDITNSLFTKLVDFTETTGRNPNSPFVEVNPSPLPVALLFFSATRINQKVWLKWSTASETNSSKFIVQRSTDGSHFTSVGMINAAGFSNSRKDYYFEDIKPVPSISYYRILEKDNDGKCLYSQIEKVYFNGFPNEASIIYNPVQNEAIVNVYSNSKNQFEIRIIDAQGRVCLFKSISASVGDNKINLDASFLTKGFYSVLVVGADFKKALKMIKN